MELSELFYFVLFKIVFSSYTKTDLNSQPPQIML